MVIGIGWYVFNNDVIAFTATEEDDVTRQIIMGMQTTIIKQEVKLSSMVCAFKGLKKHGSKGYQNSGISKKLF